MGKCLIAFTALFAVSASAANLVDGLVGKYQPVNCPYYSEAAIFKSNGFLIVEGQRAYNGLFDFSEEIKLNTRGKKFNCTPGASYGDVQCRVREVGTRLVSEERGCLIVCGPWHLKISVQQINHDEIAIINRPDQQEACIFRKL